MTKQTLILFLFYIFVFAARGVSQTSAQATMRVSVEVVKGSSIEVSKPQIAILSDKNMTTLGLLKLKGVQKENVIVSNSSKIKLKDNNGNEIEMNIRSSVRDGQDSNEIRFKGFPKGKMISSLYTGEITTTIEYY